MSAFPVVHLQHGLTYRKSFTTIDDLVLYKRCRVQLHAQGIVLRDEVLGVEIKTKQQQLCRTGDFLVAEIDAKLGGFGIVPPELAGAIVSSHYFLYEVDETQLDRKYLGYFIRTPAFQDQVSAQGTTNYAAIRPQHVLEYQLPLPSLNEQQRIVAYIDALAIELAEARGLCQDAMEEAINSFEAMVDTQLGALPIDLATSIKDLTTKIGSGSTPTGGRAVYLDMGVPFIRSLNIRMRYFQWDNIAHIDEHTHQQMSGTWIRPNDVLLNITGASIGRVALVPSDLQSGNVNQHVAIIRPKAMLDARFLMYWLSQSAVQKYIDTEQKGATRQGFTKTQIENMQLPLIPLEQQRVIVAQLDNLLTQVNQLASLQTEAAAELDSLLPSILDRAFRGEL